MRGSHRTQAAGFTLIEVLVVVLIIALIAVIGIPALLSQRAKAQDAEAVTNLDTAGKTAMTMYVSDNSYDPNVVSVVSELNAMKERSLQFMAYADGDHPSDSPRAVSVDVHPSGKQISVCVKSRSGTFFCERRDEVAKLNASAVANTAPELANPGVLALIIPSAHAIPDRSNWDRGPSVSRASGASEPQARCRLRDRTEDEVSGDCDVATAANPDGVEQVPPPNEPADVTPPVPTTPAPPPAPSEPEPEPEPEESYEDLVEAAGPSARCYFDEADRAIAGQANQERAFACRGFTGRYRDDSGRVSWFAQQQGALDPSRTSRLNKSVRFVPTPKLWAEADSGSDAVYETGSRWTSEIWVKLASANGPVPLAMAESKWLMRSNGNAFECNQRQGHPWDVKTASGGPKPVTDVWYHVACVYDNGTLSVYVNGVKGGQITGVSGQPGGAPRLKFGQADGSWQPNDYYLDGWLDEFAFYKGTALSDQQLAARYAAGRG